MNTLNSVSKKSGAKHDLEILTPPRTKNWEFGWFAFLRRARFGATLEQHKDDSELVSATGATTWIEFAST
jgi:hypothetical protein